tara:strand:+ start:422 stop:748 length:327 start_codon:yes stop_codon:yes gene_type:complete
MSYQDYIRTITNMGALGSPQQTPQPQQRPAPQQMPQQPQQMPPMPMQQMPGQQKKLDPAKSYMKALAKIQEMHAGKGITRGQGALGATPSRVTPQSFLKNLNVKAGGA